MRRTQLRHTIQRHGSVIADGLRSFPPLNLLESVAKRTRHAASIATPMERLTAFVSREVLRGTLERACENTKRRSCQEKFYVKPE